MNTDITLQIILEKPPGDVDFGLQKGKGNAYETVQKQRSEGKDLRFECSIGIKKGKNNDVDFSGPFVQGPAGKRFLYIGIGTYAGQTNTPWARRLKIPLDRFDPDSFIGDENSAKILETKIPGTGRDGGPNCATVKPFSGWIKKK